MTLIVKQFSFDSSHQLVGHNGKCANVHGHTYKLEVGVIGKSLNDKPGESDDGMVIDFTNVKNIVKPIVDSFDHAFLAQGNEPIITSKSLDTKIVHLGFRSTAENMAFYLFGLIYREMESLFGLEDMSLCFIRLWETPTGYAEIGVDEYLDSLFYGEITELSKLLSPLKVTTGNGDY